jgi:WD40 repeat protein
LRHETCQLETALATAPEAENYGAREAERYGSWPANVAFSLDGQQIFSEGSDPTSIIRYLTTSRELLKLQEKGDCLVADCAQRLATTLVSARPDGSGIYDTKLTLGIPGQRNFSIPIKDFQAGRLVFRPDGKLLVTAGFDSQGKWRLLFWDPTTGKVVRVFQDVDRPTSNLAFSPDGERLASAGGAKLTVWETSTGRVIFALDAPDIIHLTFSPHGERLASGHGGERGTGRIRVWNARTGRKLLSIRDLAEPVSCLAFSPDGKRLASSTGGRGANTRKATTVTLWELTTGEPIINLPAGEHVVRGLAFSPDGGRLACAGGGGVIVWTAALPK